VKRLGSAAIPRPAIRAMGDQECGNITPKARSRHVESRVPA
jgi:hypothetical protein